NPSPPSQTPSRRKPSTSRRHFLFFRIRRRHASSSQSCRLVSASYHPIALSHTSPPSYAMDKPALAPDLSCRLSSHAGTSPSFRAALSTHAERFSLHTCISTMRLLSGAPCLPA